MTQESIFSPFFATIFLTLCVWVYMYIRRISFINSQKVKPQDLVGYNALAKLSPPQVSNPSDNLKNLFEIPVIFYAIVLYLFDTKQVDFIYLYAAWTFVIFRVLHSVVHCTFNLILLRFYLYLFATLAVWFMVLRAAFVYLNF
ncbi:MAPEG family protein [Myxosarcina sp. GI1]|uniref:MAPEG family protein n=1 Tax=Myxosarcina sp. GI1 TaxID=1541065 RepID=UPI000561F147|nr:MAPEG family protein [Myxosarcina sp. GI1]